MKTCYIPLIIPLMLLSLVDMQQVAMVVDCGINAHFVVFPLSPPTFCQNFSNSFSFFSRGLSNLFSWCHQSPQIFYKDLWALWDCDWVPLRECIPMLIRRRGILYLVSHFPSPSFLLYVCAAIDPFVFSNPTPFFVVCLPLFFVPFPRGWEGLRMVDPSPIDEIQPYHDSWYT